MRKKSVKTTAKSTEAITETAAKVKETVKAAAIWSISFCFCSSVVCTYRFMVIPILE
mgnify:CR=1 FL=1